MVNRGYIRFLYNQNPFYLISACCVLYGIQSNLKTPFRPQQLMAAFSHLGGLRNVDGDDRHFDR